MVERSRLRRFAPLAFVVDLALEANLPKPLLGLFTAIGTIGPDRDSGVGFIEHLR